MSREHRREADELISVERALELAHHVRIEGPSGARDDLQQQRGLWAIGPLHSPGTTHVEELRDDPAVTGDQLFGEVTLPPP